VLGEEEEEERMTMMIDGIQRLMGMGLASMRYMVLLTT